MGGSKDLAHPWSSGELALRPLAAASNIVRVVDRQMNDQICIICIVNIISISKQKDSAIA